MASAACVDQEYDEHGLRLMLVDFELLVLRLLKTLLVSIVVAAAAADTANKQVV
jgi:hypothetical protein